jgi:hypothetical protein
MNQKWQPVNQDGAYRALAAATILQAIEDVSSKDLAVALEARRWLRDEGIWWALAIGINVYHRFWLSEDKLQSRPRTRNETE